MSDIGGKTLERKRDGRMLAGVCAGLGSFFGVLVYVVAWAVIPEEGRRSRSSSGW